MEKKAKEIQELYAISQMQMQNVKKYKWRCTQARRNVIGIPHNMRKDNIMDMPCTHSNFLRVRKKALKSESCAKVRHAKSHFDALCTNIWPAFNSLFQERTLPVQLLQPLINVVHRKKYVKNHLLSAGLNKITASLQHLPLLGPRDQSRKRGGK